MKSTVKSSSLNTTSIDSPGVITEYSLIAEIDAWLKRQAT